VTRLPGARLDAPGRRRPFADDGDGGGADGDLHKDPGVRIGVLALQGDVLEHVRALEQVGAEVVAVRTAAQLDAVDAIVLPGGESTAISKALDRGGLAEPLQERLRQGMPALGTCAGLILLSDELEGDEQLPRPGGLAVRTRRNAYGSQVASFDAVLTVDGLEGGSMPVSFIRAPRIEAVLSDDVHVLAQVDGHPVVVAQGGLLAMSFHPEVTGDVRLHRRFVDTVRAHVGR
jgi:pyridoxal 5'-phosphate synthase pdxT subunit